MLDYKIHNYIDGQDELVLIHGLGGNSNIFYKQLKSFKRHYNVITVELPGHGNSPDINSYTEDFSSQLAAQEVIKTLDSIGIHKAHFVGVSLGTIIIHDILKSAPEKVQSAILAGTVTRFTPFSKFLLALGTMVKDFTPYMWIYRLFARIMMPRSNHKESRLTFVKEAMKMKRTNFLGWYDLCHKIEKSIEHVHHFAPDTPKLYVSGNEDHLFLNPLTKDIKKDLNAKLVVINSCGHVCNIEKAKQFNEISLEFLSEQQSVLSQAN
ncbi:alpha/beta fold hydrolase [Aquisalibacillus elongatus]|uniref:Pimeloyl-ACP methyl ester carboxylesterase n=1 Tax=Aquisalibacillus elongatus TaxID=485577 RepID=A0A3N5C955_9BACI|nr:alpha/beta hydrolase [Aquisalibacillus elongatus]RPF56112.1 pimeloyl-ACP methyl ester carboxylesterase [Aquisalibacillus elongatus]